MILPRDKLKVLILQRKFKKWKVGGLFNIKGVEKLEKFKNCRREKPFKNSFAFRDGCNSWLWNQFSYSSRFGFFFDTQLVQQSARVAANEASASGINWTFSPMVDISRDPRWGRVAEGAGEDPYLGFWNGKSNGFGYQGKDLSLIIP